MIPIKENFIVEYNPDYRQEIADSWPESIDDISAQNDWGWYPKYDLNKTINEMIRRLENIKK